MPHDWHDTCDKPSTIWKGVFSFFFAEKSSKSQFQGQCYKVPLWRDEVQEDSKDQHWTGSPAEKVRWLSWHSRYRGKLSRNSRIILSCCQVWSGRDQWHAHRDSAVDARLITLILIIELRHPANLEWCSPNHQTEWSKCLQSLCQTGVKAMLKATSKPHIDRASAIDLAGKSAWAKSTILSRTRWCRTFACQVSEAKTRSLQAVKHLITCCNIASCQIHDYKGMYML